MRFAAIFVYVMLFIPVIGVLLYSALNPRETFLWGKRWQFKNEDLEPSDEAIKNNRVASIIALIIMVLLLVVLIIES